MPKPYGSASSHQRALRFHAGPASGRNLPRDPSAAPPNLEPGEPPCGGYPGAASGEGWSGCRLGDIEAEGRGPVKGAPPVDGRTPGAEPPKEAHHLRGRGRPLALPAHRCFAKEASWFCRLGDAVGRLKPICPQGCSLPILISQLCVGPVPIIPCQPIRLGNVSPPPPLTAGRGMDSTPRIPQPALLWNSGS